MSQVTTSHSVKFDSVFDRPLDAAYSDGGVDQYRMCEWGHHEARGRAECGGLRVRKIVALGASMSKFAIVVAGDSNVYEPEMLKDKAVAGDAEQRLPLHDAEDAGRLPDAGAHQDDERRNDAPAARGRCAKHGRGG